MTTASRTFETHSMPRLRGIEAIYEDVIFPPEETEVQNQPGGLL
jgi:hypothetical protein